MFKLSTSYIEVGNGAMLLTALILSLILCCAQQSDQMTRLLRRMRLGRRKLEKHKRSHGIGQQKTRAKKSFSKKIGVISSEFLGGVPLKEEEEFACESRRAFNAPGSRLIGGRDWV